MSREKIEEMARDLYKMIGNSPKLQAEKLYAKDYRKQSEVVKEILEKAASKFAGHSDYHGDTILQVLYCMAEGKEVDNAKPLDAKQSEPFSRPHENDGEWISVEERLPEPTYCVLVYGDEGEMEIDALGYDGEWMGYVDVTHWMPLPEAPKKGGGEG